MSGREKKEEATEREGNQGICVKCRRLLPASVMGRDSSGCLTAWCDSCRGEVAKNWGVEPDMVEWIRCMYTYEKFLQAEAETVLAAKVNMGRALPGELTALKGRIHNYHMIRHSRLRDRLRHALAQHREDWYNGVGMDMPDLMVEFPVATAAS